MNQPDAWSVLAYLSVIIACLWLLAAVVRWGER